MSRQRLDDRNRQHGRPVLLTFLPRRIAICRRSRSMSFTRSSRHSCSRRPAPYRSATTPRSASSGPVPRPRGFDRLKRPHRVHRANRSEQPVRRHENAAQRGFRGGLCPAGWMIGPPRCHSSPACDARITRTAARRQCSERRRIFRAAEPVRDVDTMSRQLNQSKSLRRGTRLFPGAAPASPILVHAPRILVRPL